MAVFAPKQRAKLRRDFIPAGAEAISGTSLQVGSVPGNRLAVSYLPLASAAAVALTGAYDDLVGVPDIPAPGEYATAEQGDLADSAVQPGSLATVAFSGLYTDLLSLPTIPAVPADIGAATADQGAKADTALQPSDPAQPARTVTFTGSLDVGAGATSGVVTLQFDVNGRLSDASVVV